MTRRIDKTALALTGMSVLTVILITTLTCVIGYFKVRINSLESRLSIIQSQQLTITNDQAYLTEKMADFMEKLQVDTFESSAYSPLEDLNGLNSWGDGELMNAGVNTREYINTGVSVDPKVIPLGTKIWIEGIGWRIATDTGGLIQGKKLDIPMRYYADAMKYGTPKVTVIWQKSNNKMEG